MSAAAVTRRVQRLLIAALVFLLAWQLAALLGQPRTVQVLLGLHGFVFHVVFAKAYALVPAYFARELATPRAPALQLPLSSLGVVGLVAAALGAPPVVGTVGAVLWFAGVLVFVAALAWTVRDNLVGGETGTGEAKADRRAVDRFANAFVPIVLAYLLAGGYDLLAGRTGLPTIVGRGVVSTHLLAAGAATLLVLAVGVRLLPRLLVTSPPRPLVAVTLPAAAVAPALLGWSFFGGVAFLAGAVLEAVGVVGYAITLGLMFARSDRRRVGGYAVLLGAAAAIVGVALGVDFAARGPSGALGDVHARLNLLGFLGLTIVGVTYHFYPPGASRLPGAGDRTALGTVGLLAGGLLVEVAGLASGVEPTVLLGRLGVLVGATGYTYLIVGVLHRQRR